MGALPNEPSMEEILSSIKRIIAEEDTLSSAPRTPRRAAAPVVTNGETRSGGASDDHVLELTDALPGEADMAATQEEPAMSAPTQPETKAGPKAAKATGANAETVKAEGKPSQAASPAPATVMSDDSARAARDSLVNLSKLLVTPEDGQSNTLEALVREMLRPMLKDWLDANLPHMVEAMVKSEIDRITGRV